jgi:hypothetical protein
MFMDKNRSRSPQWTNGPHRDVARSRHSSGVGERAGTPSPPTLTNPCVPSCATDSIATPRIRWLPIDSRSGVHEH